MSQDHPGQGHPYQDPSHADGRAAIGVLNESSLHAALKRNLAQEGDRLEVPLDGYLIDILRGDLVIEVQVQSFYQIRDKLRTLLRDHPVMLVHPIPQAKWIVKVDPEDRERIVSRRKSPKKRRLADLFDELIYMPRLINDPKLSITVLLTHEDEIRCADGRGSWRRKGVSILDRRLLQVVDEVTFRTGDDLLHLLPRERMPASFTARDVAQETGLRIRSARKMVYCLREMGAIERIGKGGRAFLYELAHDPQRGP